VVKIAPYGTWTSPIDAKDVASSGGGPSWLDMHSEEIWWAESLPAEGGRLELCRHRPGRGTDRVLGAPWNVRNRLHEYGGRPFVVIGAQVAFTHWDDQRIYLATPDSDGAPVPLTPEPARRHGWRYGDLVADPDRTALWCVRETVTGELPTDIRRDLVAVPLDGSAATDPARVRVLASSHHFLTAPKPSPDGRHAAWLGWNHPAMPWDGTQLCVAEVTEAGFGPHRVLAGGPTEAVCQVEWDSADAVLAVTDPDGWWNVYRVNLDGTALNLHPCQEELGGPLWRVGARYVAKLDEGRYAVYRHGTLAILDEQAGTLTDIAEVSADWPAASGSVTAHGEVLTVLAAGPRRDVAVLRVDLGTSPAMVTELTPQPTGLPDPAYLPVPRERVFTDPHGRDVPAFVYPPTNPDFAAPDGERPPYLVHVHGGPTGGVSPTLDLDFSYFTSRGFGVVAVNYGGSVGYGREFRERLREQWGVVDVQDCAAVATALAAEGTADGDRLAIRGGSAGGWTSAASLTSVEVYRCGTVLYPILDLRGWTAEGGQTHDFESRYVEGLVGSLARHPDRYADRSPSRDPRSVAGPVLMMQGLDDQICPPVQADEFMAALEGSGIPHAYLRFEGEQHGFRKAETIQVAHEAELSFYGQVLGFTTPGVPQLGLSR
jgi:dipeptidyl aminopeptidase/acylaminoacyl peptidase